MGAEEAVKKEAEAIPIDEDDEERERREFLASTYGPKVLIDEEVNADDKKLLSGKRKRKEKKLKRLPVRLIRQKTRKVVPSIYQQIFNAISKSDTITEDGIKKAAGKLNYELEKSNVEFFLELGKAKASIKKYGLPGDICKKKFHVFSFLDFYENASTITDDKVVWDCYYSQLFTNAWKNNYLEYAEICKLSKLDTVSIVSDKVFKCEKAETGYVQDYLKSVGIIAPEPVNPNDVETITKAIQGKEKNTLTVECVFRNDAKMTFYQYNQLIMCVGDNSNLGAALNSAKKIKIVNTKNKLAKGVKEIKVNNNIGTYLNIHEVKLVEFVPSCLFVTPAAPEVKLFVTANLETNTVYNTCKKSLKDLKTISDLPLPPNAVFWDNLSSFIQLIGLLKILDPEGIPENVSKNITEMIEFYYSYKDIFTAWKKTYKIFETIVVSFYDAVTTKLTIDGVVKLQTKVTDLLANYTFLKNETSYNNIRIFIMNIPKAKLMLNFVAGNGPYELGTSIAKLITILSSGKKVKEDGVTTIEEMFRTIGILCTETFFGGSAEMIPKVRSRASFLGITQGEMNNETLQKNIKYLIGGFNTELKKKEATAAKKMFLNYEQMDEIIDRLIDNSDAKLNDKYIHSFIDRVKMKIKSDKTLINSLREDVMEMRKNGESIEDILAFGDFLDNTLFNSFIATFRNVSNILDKASPDVDVDKILINFRIAPGAKKKIFEYLPTKNRPKNVDINAIPLEKKVEVDVTNTLKTAARGFNENVDPKVVYAEVMKAVGPTAAAAV